MKRFVLVIGSIVLVIAAGFLTVMIIKSLDDPGRSQDVAEDMGSTPELAATQVLGGLDHPWDVDFLPDGTMVLTERSGQLSLVSGGSKVVLESPSDIKAGGEGGLMGLAVDPDYLRNKFVYACFNTRSGDIKVARWAVNATSDGLLDRRDIVTGIPAAASGRHSGCQLAFGPDKNLWIATGDAADENQPQSMTSLGGKILRVTRDGSGAEGNPIGPEKRVFSYGHRNLQAIAFYDSQKDTSFGITVEHGPDRDDEVNELSPGNFGWAPGPGYDESKPMTDIQAFPDSIGSIWSSGDSTIAPSGAAILKGGTWGRLEGWLAVSVLKDKKLLLLNVTNGSVAGERVFLEGEYGRLRAATLGPDGALYVSTDNGVNDAIIKITPTGA